MSTTGACVDVGDTDETVTVVVEGAVLRRKFWRTIFVAQSESRRAARDSGAFTKRAPTGRGLSKFGRDGGGGREIATLHLRCTHSPRRPRLLWGPTGGVWWGPVSPPPSTLTLPNLAEMEVTVGESRRCTEGAPTALVQIEAPSVTLGSHGGCLVGSRVPSPELRGSHTRGELRVQRLVWAHSCWLFRFNSVRTVQPPSHFCPPPSVRSSAQPPTGLHRQSKPCRPRIRRCVCNR